ncbi:MAG TPA: response regulator, partial [Candidatus Polarisedimenticolaceae bacterium]|nr:response regulator [Candidatus Polarisedimenticolaceae bacterium]
MPRTILLADDSITIRKVVELTFGDTDIRVESVGSGREAIERLRDLKPDLVLADVVMPGPSGYEVCRAVKKSVRPVPVLLLAGTFEPFDADQARACGSDGYVTKPFDARSLVERVEALLA